MSPPESAFAALREFASLGPNWDSYGAAPITATAISAAEEILATSTAAEPFTVVPMADGGVQMEWIGPGRELEVEIGPDARLAYLVIERKDDGPHYTETANVTREEVLKQITAMNGRPA